MELWCHLGQNEGKRLHSWREHTVGIARDALSGQLVEQAGCVRGGDAAADLAILDGTEVDRIEGPVGGVTTEEDGVEEVHLQDLTGDIIVGVW